MAKDSGSPARSATVIVYVTVQRNFFSPTFLQTSYDATILETLDLGVSITAVSAGDRDSLVCIKHYS